MARSSTPIVSLLGLVQSIVINLIRRLETLGGNEDDVRVLANPDHPVIQQVAELILRSRGGGVGLLIRYKNWPAICEALRPGCVCPEDARPWDPAVVWANALANPHSEYGKRLAVAFPEFWSPIEVQGPVPWSMLKQEAARGNMKDVPDLDPCNPDDHNRLYDLSLGLPGDKLKLFPKITFACPGTDAAHYLDSFPAGLLPDAFTGDEQIGVRVSWRGSEWIVIQNLSMRGDGSFSITPAECIALDL